MTIEEYFGDWAKVIDLKEADRIVKKLSASYFKICPNLSDVFKAFKLCPLNNLQVICLSQDPYPNLLNGKPVATGIAFANHPNTPEKSFSPSLEVLRESVIDYTIPHGIVTFDQSLEEWEEQGVLMLNSALTCEVNKPGSHILLWRPFIQSLLTNLSLHSPGTVYVLMGTAAWAFEPYIKQTNHIIRIRHPSYYARTNTRMPSDVWREVNKILISQRGYGIEWYQEYKQ